MDEKDTTLKQNVSFLQNTFNKAIFPAMLSLLSVSINVFVDGILVSNKLGGDALAAVSISLPVYLFLCIIGSFFASGTAINAARAIGDNDPEKSQMYYRTCIVVLFFISIFVTVLGLLFCNTITSFLCTDRNISGYVRDYVWITLLGALPKIMLYVPFWYLRLDGKNKAVAVIMAVMAFGNIILDVLFVFYLNMGVFGAGLASVLATTAAFIIGMLCLKSKKCFFEFKFYCIKGWDEWKVIASTGIPSALNNLLSTLRLLIINSVLLSYGGSTEVAVFSAVNGITGFAECITLGIPQAASPMLGVFSGEQDNGSIKLLIGIQLKTGLICAAIFAALCLGLSVPIQHMYGLKSPMFMPLLWLSLSILPGLICMIISGYYNSSGRNMWANLLIFFRVLLMTYVGLRLVTSARFSTYSFLLIAELLTLVAWFIASKLYSRRHPELSGLLQMDTSLEERGSILNFSVGSEPSEICSASEKISSFCENNGMDMKTTMRVQLAMEEIMTLISSVNDEEVRKNLSFDLRAYHIDGLTGIRIRYMGKDFNPFIIDPENEDLYMGIMMLKSMVTHLYMRTFGVNSLQISIRKSKPGLKPKPVLD